jgi:hypothetical protein
MGTNIMSVYSRSNTSLDVKKRRRRRNDDNNNSEGISGSNELPDFDLETNEDSERPPPSSVRSKLSSSPDKITDLMMGYPDMKVRSVKELILDRSLEKRFEFDDQEDAAIPDFPQLVQASSSSSAPGEMLSRKKTRQAERRANAIQARDSDDDAQDKNPLSNIGFIKNDKGEVSPVKILEAGAWFGIFLLVGWELYLNSPFFQRAAPMAPIVYEILL